MPGLVPGFFKKIYVFRVFIIKAHAFLNFA